MTIQELIAAITALGLDPDTQVVLTDPTVGSQIGFKLEVCHYEYPEGDVGVDPDPGGWGGPEHDPRPLPKPVLSISTYESERRKPITF